MTPELAPPLLTTTPQQRENVSTLDGLNVHRCPTWRVFSGTGLELVTRQATIRYLSQLSTAATCLISTPGLSPDKEHLSSHCLDKLNLHRRKPSQPSVQHSYSWHHAR
ncbi:uncharacterized protein TNCV_4728661 [Trichonephila clavipes]|nr:uncharacterized protein TNCV_4728661 [Trichonephila clavipes]